MFGPVKPKPPPITNTPVNDGRASDAAHAKTPSTTRPCPIAIKVFRMIVTSAPARMQASAMKPVIGATKA